MKKLFKLHLEVLTEVKKALGVGEYGMYIISFWKGLIIGAFIYSQL